MHKKISPAFLVLKHCNQLCPHFNHVLSTFPRLPASSLSISCIWPKYRTKFFKFVIISGYSPFLLLFFHSFVLWQYLTINFFTFIVMDYKAEEGKLTDCLLLYACDFQPSSLHTLNLHTVILRTVINMLNFCFMYSLILYVLLLLCEALPTACYFIYTQKVSQFYLHSHFFLQTVWKKKSSPWRRIWKYIILFSVGIWMGPYWC